MESITVYPENEKQKALLQSLLEELKIRFKTGKEDVTIRLSEKEFIAKIDRSIRQSAQGETETLSKEAQKQFLGLCVTNSS